VDITFIWVVWSVSYVYEAWFQGNNHLFQSVLLFAPRNMVTLSRGTKERRNSVATISDNTYPSYTPHGSRWHHLKVKLLVLHVESLEHNSRVCVCVCLCVCVCVCVCVCARVRLYCQFLDIYYERIPINQTVPTNKGHWWWKIRDQWMESPWAFDHIDNFTFLHVCITIISVVTHLMFSVFAVDVAVRDIKRFCATMETQNRFPLHCCSATEYFVLLLTL
jgi:hypothetical protein